MSDTSTEKSPQAVEPKGEVKVPIAEVAKARADKREARAEADSLRQENENLKTASVLDADTLRSISESLAKEARAAIEAELAPIRAEKAKYQMAVQMGLSEKQADKVMEIQGKNPNLTPQQALTLARAEAPAEFAGPSQAAFNPSIHGGLPIGGNSPLRSNGQSEDFVALMNQARSDGKIAEARHWAEKEALDRFRRGFNNRHAR